MEKQSTSNVFYTLSIEDMQTVAEQELERKLTAEEISEIEDAIAAKINWYDAIADAIHQNTTPDHLISNNR